MLINEGRIRYVEIDQRKHIPASEWDRFVESEMVKTCQERTKVPDFKPIENARVSAFIGQKAVAAASARQAQQTAKKLKESMRISSTVEPAELGHVIQMTSS